ncbi:MAG: hypothetical protein IK007_00790 [Lachnospiraceae bacterium]|nr:hypothetical protein [Lachnospiraceae bacterium]
MKKVTKAAIISLLLVLSLIAPFILQGTTEVKAASKASKKTVRVATEKELKSALKDSQIATIVLRTSTYKGITIKSSKAKKKKIIIDAPNAVITNTARFKKVEVIKAKEYIEAVSGNTIKLSSNTHVQVAEGVKVKKLVSTEAPVHYDIWKNGSIKSIIIADKTHKSTFDKETGTLTFDTVGVWTSYDADYYGTTENLVTEEYPIHYTMVLDESGRILRSSYTGWATELREESKYDENGNRIEWKQYDAGSGDLELISYTDFVYEGNKVVEEIDHSFEPTTVTYKNVYDEDGRLTEAHNSSPYFSEDINYSYDDNGLLIYEETTKMWFNTDGSLSNRKSWNITYTFDKNGFLLTKEEYLIDDHMKRINTNEYDKAHNLIHETRTTKVLIGDLTESLDTVSEFRYEYNKMGEAISMW